MQCPPKENLHAFADNELDALHASELQSHLNQCEKCSAQLKSIQSVRNATKNPSLRFTAPPDLRAQIEAMAPKPTSHRNYWKPLAIAAILALGISLASRSITTGGNQNPELAEVVAEHVRSMQANHLLDVASNNTHNVKPWLDARLDFAPPVPDLSEFGYNLDGGRLDFISGRSAAALVYRKRLHVINVFITPGASADSSFNVQGYSVSHFSAEGMSVWAISDLSSDDLKSFIQSFQSHLHTSSATVP